VRISEIFYSLQGEGRLAGVPSLFIRTSGCNLRCVWCDTPYTSWRPDGSNWTLKQILREVAKHPTRYVVITGGEPMIAPEIVSLTQRLREIGAHITIETAATVDRDVACDLMSMSPKLAHSTPVRRASGKFAAMHETQRLNFEVLRQFIQRYDYQLKFVVESPRDLGEIKLILDRLGAVEPARVMLMAEGTKIGALNRRANWIVEACKTYGYSYSPRLHIQLFGNRRAT
jgi:7-carboxy-7-deazaguanine synthase